MAWVPAAARSGARIPDAKVKSEDELMTGRMSLYNVGHIVLVHPTSMF